jgi:sorting and assembly machinery component 37
LDLLIQTHAFFCLPDNWKKLTHPALASGLPIPQRYYVPFRVRESYQPRLEAAGLWDAPEEVSPSENEPKSFAERQKKQKEELPGGHFRQKFGREKV